MARSIKNSRHPERTGAAVVEFAIAISIFFVVVFASIEFVRLNMLKHSIEHASYLAARRGIIVGAKSSEVATLAGDHLKLLGVSNAAVTVNPNTINDDTQIVEVTVNVSVSGNSWISPVYYTGNLTGKTRMLAERAAAQMAGAGS
jgi:Flp pilus assembly protein TadG